MTRDPRLLKLNVKITKPKARKLSVVQPIQVSSHFLTVVAVVVVVIAGINISLLDTYRVLMDVTFWKESSSR